jgi:hypothetical protein
MPVEQMLTLHVIACEQSWKIGLTCLQHYPCWSHNNSCHRPQLMPELKTTACSGKKGVSYDVDDAVHFTNNLQVIPCIDRQQDLI